MTTDEIISRLREAKGQVGRIARESKVPYGTLRKLVTGETKEPWASTMDALRNYYRRKRPQ